MLATLEALKDALGITDTDQDVMLNSSLVQANALIAGYVGADLSDTNTTRNFKRRMDNYVGHVKLPVFPVLTVSSVSIDDVPVTDYMLEEDLGVLSGLCVEQYRWHNHGVVRVAYKAGYNPVPIDLAAACLNVAAAIFNNGGSVSTGAAGGSGELKSLTMFDAMSMSFNTDSSTSTQARGAAAFVEPWAFVLDRYKTDTPGMA